MIDIFIIYRNVKLILCKIDEIKCNLQGDLGWIFWSGQELYDDQIYKQQI